MVTDIAPKPANQKRRQIALQLCAVPAVALIIFTSPAWDEQSMMREALELAGLFLVVFALLGRLWSTLYIGGSKNKVLATAGPYSMTRNPLYFFSIMAALGIGLLFGSIVLAVVLCGLAAAILAVTSRQEARFLSAKFGDEYGRYRKRTPFLLPNLRIFVDRDELRVSTKALRRTFIDGLYFLGVFPIVEIIEYARSAGALKTYLILY